jgi:hypothetical protein
MSDDNVVVLPPHGRPPKVPDDATMLPCGWCQTMTDRAALSTYGARCFRCYQAYCREPQPGGSLPSKAEKDANPRAWAYALKAREEAGEPLTIVQMQAWREAIRERRTIEGEGSCA